MDTSDTSGVICNLFFVTKHDKNRWDIFFGTYFLSRIRSRDQFLEYGFKIRIWRIQTCPKKYRIHNHDFSNDGRLA